MNVTYTNVTQVELQYSRHSSATSLSYAILFGGIATAIPLFFSTSWLLRFAALACARLLFGDRKLVVEALLEISSSKYASLIVLVIASYGLWRWVSHSDTESDDYKQNHLIPPLLIPCRTTHRRIFPKKHSFAYSYLLAGIPIGWTRNANSMLSAPPPGHKSQTWFSVHSEDYLSRGLPGRDLRNRLNTYLQEQNVNPTAYPYAYLVTAPRFLRFSFNPVSFWYLYDRSRKLKAMILEVNNTFDERRMYFCPRATQSSTDQEDSKETVRFTHKWPKDFHVSPFNDRKGTYSVTAVDPLTTNTIDVTIVLRSLNPEKLDPNAPKIIARIHSVIQPIDPSTMSLQARASFLLKHGITGFLTNPRILYEARHLWRKGVTVYFRPEPRATTIGRTASRQEVVLERCFRAVLEDVATRARKRIQYVPGAGDHVGQTISFGDRSTVVNDELVVRVLTPAFYTQLALSQQPLMATCLGLANPEHEDQRLLELSSQNAFRELFTMEEQEGNALPPTRTTTSIKTRFLETIHGLVTRSPSAEPPDRTIHSFAQLTKASVFGGQYKDYLKATIMLALADRFAFGLVRLLMLEVLVVCLLGSMATHTFVAMVASTPVPQTELGR